MPALIKKVVLIFGTYPPMKDGGADFVYNLSTRLAQRGVETYVITTNLVSRYYEELRLDCNPKVLPIIGRWDFNMLNFDSLRLFAMTIRQIDPDIIHLIYPSSYFGNDYKLPFFIKLINRSPLVTTFFSMFKTGSSIFTKLGTLSLILFSDCLVSHDDGYIQFFNKYFPFKKRTTFFVPVGSNMLVTDNSMDRNELRKQYGLDTDKTYLSFIGQMDISKGVDTLLEALRILIDRGFKDVRLIMVGSGDVKRMAEGQGYKQEMFEYGKKIFDLQEKLNLSNYIIWTPYLPPQDFNNYILCADFCVLPFRRNTLGRSSLAVALALGMPVIIAGRANIPLLRDGENVLLVPPDDPVRLAEDIVRLANSPKLRRRLAQNSKELAKAFSWDTIISQTLNLYTRVAKG